MKVDEAAGAKSLCWAGTWPVVHLEGRPVGLEQGSEVREIESLMRIKIGRSNLYRAPLALLRNIVLKAIEPLNTLGEEAMKKSEFVKDYSNHELE